MNLKFPKEEKLKSRKVISQLFSEGNAVSKFPVKLIYLPSEKEKTQAAFAVPKRNFKSAVDRNRIKRQLREAYRLNKQDVLGNNEQRFSLLFLYLSKQQEPYAKIEAAVKQVLKKVAHENN